MPLPKNKFRELAFQVLYRTHFLQESEEMDLAFYMAALKTTRANVVLAKSYIEKVIEKLPEIDPLIKEASIGYDFERIQSVELAILRLSIYEMLFEEDIPEKVAIKEGLRLAKKFSTSDAVSFVNGVIDQVYKNKTDPVYSA